MKIPPHLKRVAHYHAIFRAHFRLA